MREVSLELFLGQGNGVIHIEEALPPLVQIGRIGNEPEAFELAVAGERGDIFAGLAVQGRTVLLLQRRLLDGLLAGLLGDLEGPLRNARGGVDGGVGQRGVDLMRRTGQHERRAGRMRKLVRRLDVLELLHVLVGVRGELRWQAMGVEVQRMWRQWRRILMLLNLGLYLCLRLYLRMYLRLRLGVRLLLVLVE